MQKSTFCIEHVDSMVFLDYSWTKLCLVCLLWWIICEVVERSAGRGRGNQVRGIRVFTVRRGLSNNLDHFDHHRLTSMHYLHCELAWPSGDSKRAKSVRNKSMIVLHIRYMLY